jgi:hypothetical protein
VIVLRSLFVDFSSYFASAKQPLNPALRVRPVALAERIKAEAVAQQGECMRTSVGIAFNRISDLVSER